MTTKQFKPGDVVTAKMGGPRMTVEKTTNGLIYCVWFDQMHVLHRDAFDAFALKVLTPLKLATAR